jgi:hypothetical protein
MSLFLLSYLMPGTRFELVTRGFSVLCSNLLSYPGFIELAYHKASIMSSIYGTKYYQNINLIQFPIDSILISSISYFLFHKILIININY